MLMGKHYYEVVSFPIDYRGRRLRAADRDPDDTFDPREKCIDVALASYLLYYAALPHSYDIALVLLGDKDLKPALERVRLLGKRVAIASIQANCAKEYRDLGAGRGLKDFEIIWLEDLVVQLEYQAEPSPLGPAAPTAGPEQPAALLQPAPEAEALTGLQVGRVKSIVADRGFGFLQTGDGRDFFFHVTALEDPALFDALERGDELVFAIEREPAQGKAGTAKQVRWYHEGNLARGETETSSR